MGGLLDALGTSYTGILAARAGVQTTSQNITNANTPGYHRRSVALSPVGSPPFWGGGVAVSGLVRAEDGLLGVQREVAAGRQGFADARQQLLVDVERGIGELGETGLGSAVSKLFGAFSQLTAAPADSGLRQQVSSAVGDVAYAFNAASARLDAVAQAADDAVGGAIAGLNRTLEQVALLNARVAQTEAAGGNAGDLRDQRTVLLSELASQLGVKSFVNDQNQTTVLLGGMTLVQDDHFAALEAVPDAALGGRYRLDLVDGGTRTDVTQRAGGALGGQIAVRDDTVGTARARLDLLAFDLGNAVNAQHRAGFGLDGSTGLDLFVVPGAAGGAAGQLAAAALTTAQLAAAGAAPGLPGDNTNMLALAQLGSTALAAGGTRTATAEIGAMAAWVGGEMDGAIGRAQAATDELAHLDLRAASTEGVSLDEEMVRLVQYQRSYEASARVLKVIDSLLARLMDL